MLPVTRELAAGENADNSRKSHLYSGETNEDIGGHRGLTAWEGQAAFPRRREGNNDRHYHVLSIYYVLHLLPGARCELVHPTVRVEPSSLLNTLLISS